MDPSNLFSHLRDESRRAFLVTLREAVEPILRINYFRHFTDHSLHHSDHVAGIVDELIQHLQASDAPLSGDELHILYASCYLHDIGMQYERAGGTATIRELDLGQPWGDLSEETRRETIRRFHHRISAEMLGASTSDGQPLIGIDLAERHFPGYIACLCEAHALELDTPEGLTRYQEVTEDGPRIRMGLLAALLRVADILDESRRRASRQQAEVLLLPLDAQVHWWRHYYAEDIEFSPLDRTVCVWFDYPPSHHDIYSGIVPQLQIPEVKAELDRHAGLLPRHDCTWRIIYRERARPYSDVVAMPDAVISEMLKQIHQRRRARQASEQVAMLQALDEARPYLEARLQTLRAQREGMGANGYLRGIAQLALDMHEMGATRSAHTMLWGAFEAEQAGVDTDTLLDVGMQLASAMDGDNWSREAAGIYEALLPAVESLSPGDVRRWRFWRARAACLSRCGALDEAAEATERAMALAPDDAARGQLRAQLAELHYLCGRLGDALGAAHD